jgi:hypothetical protein
MKRRFSKCVNEGDDDPFDGRIVSFRGWARWRVCLVSFPAWMQMRFGPAEALQLFSDDAPDFEGGALRFGGYRRRHELEIS